MASDPSYRSFIVTSKMGFGGIHQAFLGGQGKGRFPNKLLALWVLAYPSHSGPRCIGSTNPYGGKML